MEITEIENNTTSKNINSQLTTDNVTHQSSHVTRHPSPTYYDDEIDIIEYIKIIWKYKWFIILVTVLAVIGTYFYTKSLPKIYSSTVSVIIPQEEGGGSGLSAVLGGMGFGNLMAGNSNAELILEVLKSRRMAEVVSKKFNLPQYYDGRVKKFQLGKVAKKASTTTETLFSELVKLGYIDVNGKVQIDFDTMLGQFEPRLSKVFIPVSKDIFKILKEAHPIDKEIKALTILQKRTQFQATKSGVIRITVEDNMPEVAAGLANYYIIALDKINESLQITTKKPFLQVLDSAIVPIRQSKPNLKINVLIAGVLSILSTFFISFIIEFFVLAYKNSKR